MTTTERFALETATVLLSCVIADTPKDLSNQHYRRGYNAAATRAIENIRFILKPTSRKALVQFANQPRT